MSSIAVLPDDLLRVIFILSTGTSVEQKVAVSQVCADWRRVALAAPHLWSRFCLCSERDFRRINLVLLRTGSFVPLEAEMVGSSFMTHPTSHFDEAVNALVPYAARLRVLNTAGPSEDLLRSGLNFPVLETLRIKGTRNTHIDLFAPMLKLLDLELVDLLNLDQLLSAGIERVTLSLCAHVGYGDLLLILSRCPALVELTFYVHDDADDEESPPLGPVHDAVHMPNLERLDLHMSLGHMEDILGALRGPAPIAHIAASVSGRPYEQIARLSAVIVPDLAPVVAFEVDDYDAPTIVLRDTVHRVRSLCMSGVRAPRDAAEVWAHLAGRYDVHRTVCTITVPVDWWPALVIAIQLYPPQRTSGVCLRLTEGEDSDVGPIDVDLLPEAETVPIPGLQRVEFVYAGSGGARLAPDVLVSILCSLAWSGEGRLEVVLDTNFPVATRDKIETENRGRWQLVL